MAASFKKDVLSLMSTNARTLIGSDLNARHVLCGNARNNTNGVLLSDLSLLGRCFVANSFQIKFPFLSLIFAARVNVPIVVQFVVVQMYFNGFKVSETTISEYVNT